MFMAALKQSDRVRGIVMDRYVRPALSAGRTRISIRARDVLKDAEETQGFPRGRTPLVCNVLQSNKLLNEAGLEIESVDGPPSKQSRTVVVHYRLAEMGRVASVEHRNDFGVTEEPVSETPAQRAFRLTEKLRGLLKEELAEYGGGEAFIQWIRSEEGREV
jgi:hypothetical protein